MSCEQVNYSVLMCVYRKDNPQWFDVAINAMVMQTIPPEEIVIVKDGPVTEEIQAVIDRYCGQYPSVFHVVSLEKNVGLGEALRIGVPACRNEWIVRMDADDYSVPERVEKQLAAAKAQGADMIGCDVAEFIDIPDAEHTTAFRVFPENHEDIVKFGRRRTPFAHPAVVMKKTRVLAAGNYQNAYLHEDYDLFVRMLQSGCRAYTVKEPMVYVRIGGDFYKRRGGISYLRALLKFNCRQLKSGWMLPLDFAVRSAANVAFCLMPNGLRDYLYRSVLRK